jgi:hypothetical protein
MQRHVHVTEVTKCDGMQQEEWVVCRVFQKMAGNKKRFLYADHMSYQATDQGHNSPNPAVTDSGDCDTCTARESCWNCQDRFGEGHTDHTAALDATSVPPQWRSVPMAIPQNRDNHQSNPMTATIVMKSSPPPQSMVPHPLSPHDRRNVRAKVEPFYTTSCDGEDEAQSSQRLNTLVDYPWPGEVLYDHDFPVDSPLNQGESGQAYNRVSRSFPGLLEMAGSMDGMQECMWAY